MTVPALESVLATPPNPAANMAQTAAAAPQAVIGPGLRRYAWFVVAWNIAVILWGAVVRATGSGAGCGNHWPLCNGEVIPTSPHVATLIEFIHRGMTAGSTLTIVALVVWTFRATRERHLARFTAVASTLLLLNEAFLGALLVKLGYVVRNESAGRFIVLPIHLANTLLLLAALTLTAHFLSRTMGFMNGSVEYRYAGLTLTSMAATIAVGITGSLAALGDTLFPATTLAQAFAQDWLQSSPWILRLRWMHPAASLLAGVLILSTIWASQAHKSVVNRRLATAVIALILFQYVLGVFDVLLRAPTWMQIVHLFGADLFWVGLVTLAARVTVVPLGCPGNICALKATFSRVRREPS